MHKFASQKITDINALRLSEFRLKSPENVVAGILVFEEIFIVQHISQYSISHSFKCSALKYKQCSLFVHSIPYGSVFIIFSHNIATPEIVLF